VLSEKINDKKINQSALKSRIYSKREYDKINNEGIGFLIFLEKATILTPSEREIILDRAMAVNQTEVNLDELKWIVMMTLWHFGRESEYLFVEDALFNPKNGVVH
jgi:Smg protein